MARLRIAMTTGHSAERTEDLLLEHDLLVMPHGFVTDVSHDDLFRDQWVCVVSADNDEIGNELTAEQLQSLPWVATFHGPTASTPAARFIRMLGIEPHVQVVVESFLAVPDLVAGSNCVAFLQRRLARRLLPDAGVRVLACPFDAGDLVQAMWWHPVYDNDPEHSYLRDAVVRASGALRDSDGTASPT